MYAGISSTFVCHLFPLFINVSDDLFTHFEVRTMCISYRYIWVLDNVRVCVFNWTKINFKSHRCLAKKCLIICRPVLHTSIKIYVIAQTSEIPTTPPRAETIFNNMIHVLYAGLFLSYFHFSKWFYAHSVI